MSEFVNPILIMIYRFSFFKYYKSTLYLFTLYRTYVLLQYIKLQNFFSNFLNHVFFILEQNQ